MGSTNGVFKALVGKTSRSSKSAWPLKPSKNKRMVEVPKAVYYTQGARKLARTHKNILRAILFAAFVLGEKTKKAASPIKMNRSGVTVEPLFVKDPLGYLHYKVRVVDAKEGELLFRFKVLRKSGVGKTFSPAAHNAKTLARALEEAKEALFREDLVNFQVESPPACY